MKINIFLSSPLINYAPLYLAIDKLVEQDTDINDDDIKFFFLNNDDGIIQKKKKKMLMMMK